MLLHFEKLCQVESGCLTSIFKLTNFLVFPTNLDVEPLNLIFFPFEMNSNDEHLDSTIFFFSFSSLLGFICYLQFNQSSLSLSLNCNFFAFPFLSLSIPNGREIKSIINSRVKQMEKIKSWMGKEKYEGWRKEKGFYASALYVFPLTRYLLWRKGKNIRYLL